MEKGYYAAAYHTWKILQRGGVNKEKAADIVAALYPHLKSTTTTLVDFIPHKRRKTDREEWE
jgi:hypothetical protein